MPIGIHHLFADPQVGAGFKFMHSAFTAMVTLPTLLTVFTICASVEIAGRLRGGKGALGWVKALPWDNPMMLALAFSFVMLGFGGAGGLINMSYQLDATIHNTQWITGHFHLIFGGAIVIMYFTIAYDLWPHLTGRALPEPALMRAQLWLWFVGMMVLTFPGTWSACSACPGAWPITTTRTRGCAEPSRSRCPRSEALILLASGLLFLLICSSAAIARPRSRRRLPVQRRGASPPLAPALNGYALWLALMIGLTVTNYGFPIAESRSPAGRRGPCRLYWRATMSQETPLSLKDPWVVRSVVVVAAIFVGATILGFMVFPLVQPNARAVGSMGRDLQRGGSRAG